MYRGVQPGKRALIPLLVWLSKRPESLLEMFHGLLRHFANTGMRPEVADSLTLKGAAEYNLLREHRVQQMENNGDDVDCCWEFVPGYLRDRPLWYNHARLHLLNELAIAKGIDPPFPDIKAMAPNTGEVFLSKYFMEQKERNKLGKTMEGLCTRKECESCAIQFDTAAASPVVNAPGNGNVPSVEELSKVGAPTAVLPIRCVPHAPQPPSGRLLTLPNGNAPRNVPSTLPNFVYPSSSNLPIFSMNPPYVGAGGGYHPMVRFLPFQATNTMLPFHFLQPKLNQNFCCRPYAQYMFYQMNNGGKKKPGPVPHDKHCPLKKK
ncbi:unnamed protein product [Cylindrotheca closterium]|uniref:Uncharacterized protein n=1 Tax=Cylindrotheca closterium TaxID=2856 RepID=A0AAD2JHV7_9STRA|nr:unnamed protein product [Cylindrotheca closterium]